MAEENSNPPSTIRPIEFSFPFPHFPDTKVHIHLTIQGKALVLHLAARNSESSGPLALGSFVVAIPNRSNPTQPVSTPLANGISTVDFATSLAKSLARKEQKAVYVGNSIDFNRLGMSVEEVMEGQRRIVGVVLDALRNVDGGLGRERNHGTGGLNGAKGVEDGVKASQG